MQALLQVFVMGLAQATVAVARSAGPGIKDVVFCGSFVKAKIIRELLAVAFLKKKMMQVGFQNTVIESVTLFTVNMVN